jgi:hypothetical protein
VKGLEMNELKEWEKENLLRLKEKEDKAYAKRLEIEEAIIKLLTPDELVIDSKIFFQLRQAFQEYETAEQRCVLTTDRLTEFHQRDAI